MTEDGSAEFRSLLDDVVSGALNMLEAGPIAPETVQAIGPTGSGPSARPSSFGRWHVAAAVLSTFDRAALKPAADLPGLGDDDIMSLLADSTPVVDAPGGTRWKLLVEVRRDILRVIGGSKAIQQALSANPGQSDEDPVQGVFEGYVNGTALPLAQQGIGQVAATFEIAQWLQGLDVQLGSPMPDLDAIRARNDYLTLLQPFEELAGTNFAGRTQELQQLRRLRRRPATRLGPGACRPRRPQGLPPAGEPADRHLRPRRDGQVRIDRPVHMGARDHTGC